MAIKKSNVRKVHRAMWELQQYLIKAREAMKALPDMGVDEIIRVAQVVQGQ